MGRHSLWHVDVVSVAVVGVHPMRMWRRTLMCSSAKKPNKQNKQIDGQHTKSCFYLFNATTLIPTWGAASSSASEPPSSAGSRVDGSAAPEAPEEAGGAAGSGGLEEGAG